MIKQEFNDLKVGDVVAHGYNGVDSFILMVTHIVDRGTRFIILLRPQGGEDDVGEYWGTLSTDIEYDLGWIKNLRKIE